MRRLTLRQIVVAIGIGAVFASLQGDPPVAALKKLANVTCAVHVTRC
jgi:hypothetical protein